MPDACSISMRGMRNGLNADLFHGSANAVTSFRNYFAGWEPGKTGGTFGFSIYALNRYFNMVGNVLGTSSYHSIYEIYPPSFGPPTSIYQLGGGNSEGSIRIPADSLVRKTLMRWGNYDVVNAAVRWNSTESSPGAVKHTLRLKIPLRPARRCRLRFIGVRLRHSSDSPGNIDISSGKGPDVSPVDRGREVMHKH